MLTQQTLDKLNAMKLGAMADAFQKQLQTAEAAALSFEERLGLLVDTEWTAREQRKLHAAPPRGQAALSGDARSRRLHPSPPAQPPAGPHAGRLRVDRRAPQLDRHRAMRHREELSRLRPRRTGVSPRLHRALRPHAASAARAGRRPRGRLLHAAARPLGQARPARHRRLDARAAARRRAARPQRGHRGPRRTRLDAHRQSIARDRLARRHRRPQPGRCQSQTACSTTRTASTSRATRCDGRTRHRPTAGRRRHDHRTDNNDTATDTDDHLRDTRDTPAGLVQPVDPDGAVENARDALGVDCSVAHSAFPTTPWTPQTAPTATTGHIVRALYTRSRVGYRQPVATPMGGN